MAVVGRLAAAGHAHAGRGPALDLRHLGQQHLVADLRLQRRRPGRRPDRAARAPAAGAGGGGGGLFGGTTGRFRLLQSGLGDQAGWLLGFAVVAGLGLLVATRLRRRDPRTGWLIAVGGAFVTSGVVFSFASGIFHPYYVSLLAPFTAALIGAGVGAGACRGAPRRRGRLGPLAIAAARSPSWSCSAGSSGALSWAKPLVIVGRRSRGALAARARARRRGCGWSLLGACARGAARRAGHLGGRDARPRHQQHVPRRRLRPAPRWAASAAPAGRRQPVSAGPAGPGGSRGGAGRLSRRGPPGRRRRPGRPARALRRARRRPAPARAAACRRLLAAGSPAVGGGRRWRGGGGFGGNSASLSAASAMPRPTAAARSASPARAAPPRDHRPRTPTSPGWADSPAVRARSPPLAGDEVRAGRLRWVLVDQPGRAAAAATRDRRQRDERAWPRTCRSGDVSPAR